MKKIISLLSFLCFLSCVDPLELEGVCTQDDCLIDFDGNVLIGDDARESTCHLGTQCIL